MQVSLGIITLHLLPVIASKSVLTHTTVASNPGNLPLSLVLRITSIVPAVKVHSYIVSKESSIHTHDEEYVYIQCHIVHQCERTIKLLLY